MSTNRLWERAASCCQQILSFQSCSCCWPAFSELRTPGWGVWAATLPAQGPACPPASTRARGGPTRWRHLHCGAAGPAEDARNTRGHPVLSAPKPYRSSPPARLQSTPEAVWQGGGGNGVVNVKTKKSLAARQSDRWGGCYRGSSPPRDVCR